MEKKNEEKNKYFNESEDSPLKKIMSLKCKKVQNRFHLAVLLIKHPNLRKLKDKRA